jgi:2-dehydro-3-deoxygluconokinase
MPGLFVSIGECMVELAPASGDLYHRGFAGDTLNTAWYVRALTDHRVDYLTAVGTDALSRELVAFIAGAGIGTAAIRRIENRTLGLYLITLTGAERSFTYWRDKSAAKFLAAHPAALDVALGQATSVYFSGITLAILSPDHRDNLFAALAKVRARGGMVAFDPNVRPRLWSGPDAMRAGLEAGYRAATVALPTYPDECDLFADASLEAAAHRVAGYGVTEVVVRDGPNPCLVLANGAAALVPAVPVARPVDTTGAGDSFSAGYLAARLRGLPPTAAAHLAHQVAARVIQVKGALAPMADFSDLR